VDLPTPTTEVGRAGLAALVAEPGRALLGLDYDGTLAPIVDDPEQARVHPDVPPALRRLAGFGTRVAVVTGRPAAFVVGSDSGLAHVAGLVVLGHYGAERWWRGEQTAPTEDAGVDEARRRLPDLLAELAAPAGTFVEDKGRAVAVHTRRTTDPAAAFDALRGPLHRLAEQTGLVVEPGRYVLELRPSGGDKGDALRSLVEESGPAGPSVVVFIGDDLGDLPAFAEVERLRAEGARGLFVCSGSTEVTALSERADLVVDGPEGVAALLTAVADAIVR